MNKPASYGIAALAALCLALALSFTACAVAGKTAAATVTIGESAHFTEEEIRAAADAVISKFREKFSGCELTDLWYDEAYAQARTEGYMRHGRGSINGVAAENVIVLLSNYTVDASGGDGSLNPNSTYTDWNWIVIRDGKTEPWRVDDWGY